MNTNFLTYVSFLSVKESGLVYYDTIRPQAKSAERKGKRRESGEKRQRRQLEKLNAQMSFVVFSFLFYTFQFVTWLDCEIVALLIRLAPIV